MLAISSCHLLSEPQTNDLYFYVFIARTIFLRNFLISIQEIGLICLFLCLCAQACHIIAVIPLLIHVFVECELTAILLSFSIGYTIFQPNLKVTHFS